MINSTNQASSAGRVEVYRNNTWGTVCDDLFGLNDADTACKQWGARTPAISWNGRAFYGQGNGSILLDNAECVSDPNPESLFFCSYTEHDCGHNEDVGVSCPTIREFLYTHHVTNVVSSDWCGSSIII